MTSIVDTHCHVDLPQYDEDREATLQAALTAGVHALIVIGFNPERWQTCRALAERNRFIVRAAGVHPNDAEMWSDEVRAGLVAECAHEGVVAVGEIGLDFFRDRSSKDAQLRAFREQLTVARELMLPVIIHQREAQQEVLDVLDSIEPVRGVMHCFTGDDAFATACIDRGLFVGLGGVATFPRSTDLRAAITHMPIDRILVETDAPFLAPQRVRGRRNAPANVVDVVETVAALRQTSVEEIAEATTTNAIALFGPQLESAIEHGRRAA